MSLKSIKKSKIKKQEKKNQSKSSKKSLQSGGSLMFNLGEIFPDFVAKIKKLKEISELIVSGPVHISTHLIDLNKLYLDTDIDIEQEFEMIEMPFQSKVPIEFSENFMNLLNKLTYISLICTYFEEYTEKNSENTDFETFLKQQKKVEEANIYLYRKEIDFIKNSSIEVFDEIIRIITEFENIHPLNNETEAIQEIINKKGLQIHDLDDEEVEAPLPAPEEPPAAHAIADAPPPLSADAPPPLSAVAEPPAPPPESELTALPAPPSEVAAPSGVAAAPELLLGGFKIKRSIKNNKKKGKSSSRKNNRR